MYGGSTGCCGEYIDPGMGPGGQQAPTKGETPDCVCAYLLTMIWASEWTTSGSKDEEAAAKAASAPARFSAAHVPQQMDRVGWEKGSTAHSEAEQPSWVMIIKGLAAMVSITPIAELDEEDVKTTAEVPKTKGLCGFGGATYVQFASDGNMRAKVA